MSQAVLCRTMDEAQVPLRRLADPRTTTVVHDVETTGVSGWNKEVIVGHVMTFGPNPSDTYYVPVRHGEQHRGNVCDHRDRYGHPFEVALARIASTRRDLHWVGHNWLYDAMMMWGHRIPIVGSMEDTQVNAALLNEFARSFGLEESCVDAGVTPKKGDQLYQHLASKFGGDPVRRQQMGHFWKLDGDDPIGVDYATGDGVSTWELWRHQQMVLGSQGLAEIARLESGITRVVYRMQRRGVRVDEDYLRYVQREVKERLSKAESQLPADLNVRSGPQIRAWMEKVGRTGWPTTEKGNPQFKEEWLSTHPEGRLIVAVRKYRHMLDSFIEPLWDRHIVNGRVHPNYYQMASDDFGTVTGRFSCSSPNLQQVPKRNKELASLFRPVFIPDDGMEWWSADLSQCEPRLLAHYAQCKVLIEGYTSIPPVDAHSAVATAAKIDRDSGKRLNQTLLTGGGKAKVVGMLGEAGEEIFNAYFRAMPEIKTLQKRASRTMENRGYVISLLGRRARLEDRRMSYKAINRLLQCGNADIVKFAMVNIDRYLEETGDVVHMLNTVHDSLDFQARPEHAEIVKTCLLYMTDFGPGRTIPLTVPMAADYRVGPNWGAATFEGQQMVVGDRVDDPAYPVPRPWLYEGQEAA